MPVFNLPDGYSFDPPPSVQGIGVPDRGYGGADISQAFDATGQHYVACNAWGPGDPSFRWRAFKRVGAVYVEVPLPFLATGRGEQDVQWYDGRAWGIAWTGDQFNFDIIPSFVPFPSIPSLAAQVAALTARLNAVDSQIAALGLPTSDGTLVLQPQGEEGGQIAFAPGAGRTRWWFIDSYQDELRIFSNEGGMVEIRADGLYVGGAKVG